MKILALHWKTKKRTILILSMILVAAVFLRTYHFERWLHFGSDQVRDLILVEGVVEQGKPWPLLGADASNTHFRLGPAYHYFQIVSLSIFGVSAPAMAYPDVFFSILSIPLFFVLLRKYFDENLALILTVLYAVSYYAIEFSRFAWNSNPLPFFVALFLLSLLSFLENREKTAWVWVVFLGIAVGIGIQLHTLLLLLMPTCLVVVAAFLLKQNWRVVKQILLVLVVILLCNAGQIRGEMRSGGDNTKRFLAAFTDRSDGGANRMLVNFGENVLNHAQANGHILTSLGEKGHFTFATILSYPDKAKGSHAYMWFVVSLTTSLIFSFCGYGLLLYRSWVEPQSERKYFLRLMLLYVTVSFIILFPIARGAPIRYFYHTIFIPFIFLGLFFEWFRSRFPDRYRIVSLGFLLFLFGANAYTIGAEAMELRAGTRGDSGFVVLGEADRMIDSIIEKSNPKREANIFGRNQYMSTYFNSLSYLAAKRGFTFRRASDTKPPISDVPYFFLSQSHRSVDSLGVTRYDFIGSEDFGRIGVYEFQRSK